MARVTRTFVDEVRWPEYREFDATLRSNLESVTRRVISQAIHGDVADAAECLESARRARLRTESCAHRPSDGNSPCTPRSLRT